MSARDASKIGTAERPSNIQFRQPDNKTTQQCHPPLHPFSCSMLRSALCTRETARTIGVRPRRLRHSSKLGGGRQQIVEDEEVVRDRIRRNRPWPLHHNRLPDPTLVQAALLPTEVAGVVKEIPRDIGPVVAGEKDDGLLRNLQLLQRVQHRADHYVLGPDGC
jgi:hypothetical protein